jgi:uncharacterized membrane protein
LFGITMVVATIVIFASGSQLPPEVASHFNGSGHADATMSRGTYLTVMAVLANGVPVLTWWLQDRAARLGRVNIPHHEFWLAPARRAESLRFMSRHAMAMALALLVLLVSVHLLVVKAHVAGEGRPVLDMYAFVAVLLVFVAFSLMWIAGLFWRFRSPM